jgi:hypothetical protein
MNCRTLPPYTFFKINGNARAKMSFSVRLCLIARIKRHFILQYIFVKHCETKTIFHCQKVLQVVKVFNYARSKNNNSAMKS